MNRVTFDPARLQTPVTLLYDGTNAESAHEVEFLKSKNRNDVLVFVDLSSPADSAAEYGVNAADVSRQLHARDAAGEVYVGIDALYAAHAAVGLGSWFAMCRVPGFLSVGTGIGPNK